MSEADESSPLKELMLRIPNEVPVFANYVQSSTSTISEGSPMWTLMFVHIWPDAVAPDAVEMKGTAVARVSMDLTTVKSLIALLEKQVKVQTEKAESASRPREEG